MLAYLQDFTELLHDVDDRTVARPVDLTENGPQFLHSLGSGLQLLARDPGLMQHLDKVTWNYLDTRYKSSRDKK